MLGPRCAGALALAAVTSIALALPALGSAAVVQLLGDQLRIDGYEGATNTIEVRYRALDVTAQGGPAARLIVDDKAGINALGEGCVELTLESASCAAASVAGISAGLTDGNDVFVVASAGDEPVPASIPANVRGGVGNDVIKTGLGDDRVAGGAGKDTIAGGLGDDVLLGGPGIDGLIGFGGNDILRGGPGNDALFGQKGRDIFRGGAGNDVLLARDGLRDRRIDCGAGSAERAVVDPSDPRARGCSVTGVTKKR